MGARNLAHYLKYNESLHSPQIFEAIASVDREYFVAPPLRFLSHTDRALPIGYGQTISQPSVVAFMFEQLNPLPGHKILDIGSGSGWTTALLAHIVGERGKVIGTEIVPQLVTLGQTHLKKFPYRWASIRQAEDDVCGLPEEAPFHRILVSASLDGVPDGLIDQLVAPGVVVLPVRNSIITIHKELDGSLNIDTFPGFVFVPFVNQQLHHSNSQ